MFAVLFANTPFEPFFTFFAMLLAWFYGVTSNYALEALEVHGAWRGSGLALRRLGRCHPWGAHGPDPVPRKSTSC